MAKKKTPADIFKAWNGQVRWKSSPISGSTPEEAREVLSRTYHPDQYELEYTDSVDGPGYHTWHFFWITTKRKEANGQDTV